VFIDKVGRSVVGETDCAKLLGSISPTYLHTAFTPVAPKSVRIQLSCQYLFTLFGSTGAKAARRTLMKLTPCARSQQF